MKRFLLAVVLISMSSLSFAHGGFRGGYHGGYGHYENHYRGGYYHGGGWVAPALIGGIVGYELAQPRAVYVNPPVYYQSQTVYQTCTAWVESQDQYGRVTRTRTCTSQ